VARSNLVCRTSARTTAARAKEKQIVNTRIKRTSFLSSVEEGWSQRRPRVGLLGNLRVTYDRVAAREPVRKRVRGPRKLKCGLRSFAAKLSSSVTYDDAKSAFHLAGEYSVIERRSTFLSLIRSRASAMSLQVEARYLPEFKESRVICRRPDFINSSGNRARRPTVSADTMSG
jgi:hypothetical protein